MCDPSRLREPAAAGMRPTLRTDAGASDVATMTLGNTPSSLPDGSEATETASEARVFTEGFAAGWIRRFADPGAAKRREAQKAQDRSGDTLRK